MPICTVQIEFTDTQRGAQDVINALDAYELEAEVTELDDSLTEMAPEMLLFIREVVKQAKEWENSTANLIRLRHFIAEKGPALINKASKSLRDEDDDE